MNKMKKLLITLTLISSTVFAQQYQRPTDDQIRYQIINQSIMSYPGTCACPYSQARNGSVCGGRSAYSKPGGYDPICYPQQVSQYQVEQFRRQTGQY